MCPFGIPHSEANAKTTHSRRHYLNASDIKMATMLATPSLAASTNTRLDTACKHIQQCRVSQDHMTALADYDENDLMRNKFGYCVHKDELVLGIGKAWHKDEKRLQNNAYPRVLSCLGRLGDQKDGRMRDGIKMIKWMYHNARTIEERNDFLQIFREGRPIDWIHPGNGHTPFFEPDPENPAKMAFLKDMPLVHDFVTVGYANTVGWAHAHHGDTMTSVLIGGLRTVMNGDFEVFTGDLIQWYWPFEVNCFLARGHRKQRAHGNIDPGVIQRDDYKLSSDALARKKFNDREYGQRKDHEKCVALIKPYKRDDADPRLYDWYRVFAIAISSARPREAVDIRICRQAL